MYISNNFQKLFFIKQKKKQQPKKKKRARKAIKQLTSRIFDHCVCFLETNATVSPLMEVVKILNEISRRSSDFFNEILFFLYFILENSCSKMYVMPKKAMTSIKCDCKATDIFFSGEIGLIKV